MQKNLETIVYGIEPILLILNLGYISLFEQHSYLVLKF